MATEKNRKKLNADLQIDAGCVMITQAGRNFSCTDVTMAKAMIIYHHYQKVGNRFESNNLRDSDLHHLYATAAFILSVQICEEKVQMEEIIEFFNGLGDYTKEVSSMVRLKKKIKEVQYDMHKVMFAGHYKVAASKSTNFEMGCNTAHRYVFHYMYQFSTMPEIQKNICAVKRLTLKYLNTFYLCQKCITYTPLEIAWAAMDIAFLHLNIDIGNYKVLDKEVSAIVKATQNANNQNANYQKAMDDMMMVGDVGINNLSEFLIK